MNELVQTICLIPVGVASAIYIVEKVPVTYYRLRFSFYEKQLKRVHKKLKEMAESAEIRADLLWSELGKPKVDAYLDSQADADEEAREPFLHEAKEYFCMYAMGSMLRGENSAVRQMETRALPPQNVEMLKARYDMYERSVEHAKEHLIYLGFDIDQLDAAIAAS